MQQESFAPPTDTHNDIGILKRREIEARIIAPIIGALGDEFGRERVLEIVRDTIIKVARAQGAQLAAQTGGNELADFARALAAWRKDDAMQMDVLNENDERYEFDVTRCRYAEMYRALGIPELGAVLSCNRDFALIEGFNPQIQLTRTQTLMQGATCCDFRFVKQPQAESG
jgi:predicted ArsR family transcriptional regulator